MPMMFRRGEIGKLCGRLACVGWLAVALAGLTGCRHAFPVAATFQGNVGANVMADATVKGSFDVKLPTAADPGEMTSTVVRPGNSQPCARIALIDVDGLLMHQNYGSMYAVGDNPLAAFRDKLEAAARDPQVAAVVLRINSAGGSVTTCDIMAEELRQFRAETHKPVIACLLDLATAGAYYIAAESDRIVAHPTTLTGGLGVVFNHFNLQDAMAQLNLVSDPVKSGAKIDMGTVTASARRGNSQAVSTDGRRLSRPSSPAGQRAAHQHDSRGSPETSRRPGRHRVGRSGPSPRRSFRVSA